MKSHSSLLFLKGWLIKIPWCVNHNFFEGLIDQNFDGVWITILMYHIFKMWYIKIWCNRNLKSQRIYFGIKDISWLNFIYQIFTLSPLTPPPSTIILIPPTPFILIRPTPSTGSPIDTCFMFNSTADVILQVIYLLWMVITYLCWILYCSIVGSRVEHLSSGNSAECIVTGSWSKRT